MVLTLVWSGAAVVLQRQAMLPVLVVAAAAHAGLAAVHILWPNMDLRASLSVSW